MTSASGPSKGFAAHHVQLLRAAFAAIAAVMITFSPDHSAAVGLAVFSGFAIATGLVWLLSVWLVFPAGRRGMPVLMAVANLLAGMSAGVTVWRSTAMFFVIVIAWALVTGVIEGVSALRAQRQARRLQTQEPTRFEAPVVARADARDGLTVGIITIVLAIGLLLTPAQYALDYYIADAGAWFTLTGITIAVGVFGGYAAILAVYLGIAGFSPRKDAGAGASVAQATGADALAAPTTGETA